MKTKAINSILVFNHPHRAGRITINGYSKQCFVNYKFVRRINEMMGWTEVTGDIGIWKLKRLKQ